MKKISLIGGSLRSDSFNLKLLLWIEKELVSRGLKTESFFGNDLRCEWYESSFENSNYKPESILRMYEAIVTSNGVIFVSPEYNAGIPGFIKNVIDWLSRCKPNPFSEKVVLLASSSSGQLAGTRGLTQLRQNLNLLEAIVLPVQITIANNTINQSESGEPTSELALKNAKKAIDVFLRWIN